MQVRAPSSVFQRWPRPDGWLAAVRLPRTWVTTLLLVGVIGGGLAISHANETDWLTRMSLSGLGMDTGDRKSTRLNSSHTVISYAVFCLNKNIINSLTGAIDGASP